MFEDLENFFQRTHACTFVVIVNGLWTIVYKHTDEWCIEWQRMTTSGATNKNQWYNEWEPMTTNDNKWQLVTASGTTNETPQHTSKNGWLASLLWQKTDTLLQVLDGCK